MNNVEACNGNFLILNNSMKSNLITVVGIPQQKVFQKYVPLSINYSLTIMCNAVQKLTFCHETCHPNLLERQPSGH